MSDVADRPAEITAPAIFWTFRIGDAPQEIGLSQATVRRRAKCPDARLKLKKDGNCTYVVIDDKAEYFNSLPDAGDHR